jgi:hypothetical protein
MPTQHGTKRFLLETANDRLEFDGTTGKLVSFRAKLIPHQELLEMESDAPAFVIQYLTHPLPPPEEGNAGRNFCQITSQQARKIDVDCEYHSAEGIQSGELIATFRNLDGLNIDVTVKVSTSSDDRFSYWSFSLANKSGLLITDVQFPFIVVPYKLGGTPGTETLLRPFNMGQLLRCPKPQELEQDSSNAWQFRPENGDSGHYPGLTFAQFLAYFDDQIGVYISCQDGSGRVKLIKPVHHNPPYPPFEKGGKGGLRLGIAHVGDWPEDGQRELEYKVALGSFTGDWYDAADLYKDWSQHQKWAKKPLHVRQDVPEWLLDSPPHIILRIQGELDDGPAEPNEEFLPYPKSIPLLEKVADRINAPLVPVIMSWERPGPWVYPDCFPPAGGEESLHEFTELAREQRWHIGTFCNGTRWVIGHRWSGYNGEDYFKEKNGESSVCRTHTGELWKEAWDRSWRPSYACCLNVHKTRDIAEDFVRKIVDSGLDWVQFLDQNVGCCTFPCYATNHGHPSAPGRWMTDEMNNLLDTFDEIAAEEYQRSQGLRQIVYSVECPINEYFIPRFHICDVRVIPPGHYPGMRPAVIPLYHYLYHEFILIQGGFGYGPEPYHLPIRNAYNLVIGEIPGAVMKGDGLLLNKDTGNWAPWEPQVGSNEDALQILKAATVLRRGKGKDFLVYGRMLRPADVQNVNIIRWQQEGREHQIPAVFHAAWQAPDGRLGIVLANWTTETQEVRVVDERLGDKVLVSVSADSLESRMLSSADGNFMVTLPKLSFILLERVNN